MIWPYLPIGKGQLLFVYKPRITVSFGASLEITPLQMDEKVP